MTIEKLRDDVKGKTTRSAWDRGVQAYALELIDELDEAIKGGYFDPVNLTNRDAVKKAMLNGARSWAEYSEGGSALIYDGDIAARLCSPSEYKRSREGERNPNAREDWLDVQARALAQAAIMILRVL